MARPLAPLNLPIPAIYGLNKQTSDQVLPIGWATKADNLVFNSSGRIASRKGIKARGSVFTESAVVSPRPFEYIDATGASIVIHTDADGIRKETGTSPSATYTDIRGSVTTFTNWKFVNFNGKCVGHHPSYPPIELDTVGGTFAAAGGTQFNGTDVLAAYGRLWVINGNVLYYSDLLINSFAGGFAGSFDMAVYWPNGMDEAVALASWNNHILVFGKNSILIYENPDDPTTSMALVDEITGIGCIARDSIQPIGTDLLFLSNEGVKSIGRVIQERSMPVSDVSANVRDYVRDLATSTETVSSLYSQDERFYLLAFQDAGVVLCFDIAGRLEDGSYRVTEWNLHVSGMTTLRDRSVVMNVFDPAGTYSTVDRIFNSMTYTGYYDFINQDGSGGETYTIDYEGAWNDFGQEVQNRKKIFKSLTALMGAPDGDTATVKWAFDYDLTFTERSIVFDSAGKDRIGIRLPMSGDGQVLKIGVESLISGSEKTLQRFNVMAKLGRYV